MMTAILTIAFVCLLAAVLALRPKSKDYVPGDKDASLTESLARSIPPDCAGPKFEDVTAAAGIHFVHFHGARSSQLPEDIGSGGSWRDYDGDGYPDLFLANEAGPLTLSAKEVEKSPARCALYHNNGDGTFTDVTDKMGLGTLRGCFMGAAWADYDNDGKPDLFITAFGRNRLFHNEGDRFKEVTAEAGMGGVDGFWTGASWCDYDRDGRLDLYVCGYVKYHTPMPNEKGSGSKQFDTDVPFTLNPSSYSPERNLLYHNNGDGTFTEVAKSAGVQNASGRSLSAAWCDFDEDGWPDLYVNNDVSMHAFYRNLGNGRFKDVTTTSWACDYRGGMGIAVGDWDNNGNMDLFLTHWIAQEKALYHNLLSQYRSKKPADRLHFMDISDQVGLGQSTLDYIGWGTSFLDFDNDGRLDLAIANGSTFEETDDHTKLVAMKNQLFWNGSKKAGYTESGTNDRGFFEVEDVCGDALKKPNVARGLAVADFDRDGSPDILITRNGGPPLLARNAGARGHWLEIELRGAKSNRDAIGARISIEAGGLRQARVVGATSTYLSQDDLVQHFGLGENTHVSRVEILWPSGAHQKFQSVTADRYLRITEGGQPSVVSLKKATARK